MIKTMLNNVKNNKFLFLITILYFILGFVNIHFALLGLFCMMIPFVLLFRNKKKTWCQGYCPRANLYTRTGKVTSKYSFKTPEFFTKGGMKWIMLSYFGISLFFIGMTTVKVAMGAVPPMNVLRFLILFKLPIEMPQMIAFASNTPWLTHLAYRFYSMMMTTTFLGLILALVYKPRTWCIICPVGTLSDTYLKQNKKMKA